MKKKLRCKNCGTVIKDTDFSCPICHMKPDRTEEEVKQVEDNIIHNNNKTIVGKFIIAFMLVIGIALCFISILHLKEVTYCTDSNCTTKNLFMLFIGATLTVSSIITLFRFRKK